MATDLDLAADFPPLGLNENITNSNAGNGQIMVNCDEHSNNTLMANRAPLPKAVWPIVRSSASSSDSTAVIENNNIQSHTKLKKNSVCTDYLIKKIHFGFL